MEYSSNWLLRKNCAQNFEEKKPISFISGATVKLFKTLTVDSITFIFKFFYYKLCRPLLNSKINLKSLFSFQLILISINCHDPLKMIDFQLNEIELNAILLAHDSFL